jgi:hypothetical protein
MRGTETLLDVPYAPSQELTGWLLAAPERLEVGNLLVESAETRPNRHSQSPLKNGRGSHSKDDDASTLPDER